MAKRRPTSRSTGPTSSRRDAVRAAGGNSDPPPADLPASQEAERGAVVLWGSIVSESAMHLTFAVANIGQAKEIGLCGEHVFAKRQIIRSGGPIDNLDFIVVPYALANLKAQSCQRCD